jgi:hypothetical protein
MQPGAGIGGQTNDIAGIRRYFRLKQDYVQHEREFLPLVGRSLSEVAAIRNPRFEGVVDWTDATPGL